MKDQRRKYVFSRRNPLNMNVSKLWELGRDGYPVEGVVLHPLKASGEGSSLHPDLAG